MSTLLLTLTIAFVIVIIAVSLLAIGWLVTGKSRIQAGACGRDPNKQKDEGCNTAQCQLCEHQEEKKKTE